MSTVPKPDQFRARLLKQADETGLAELRGKPSENLPRYKAFLTRGTKIVARYHRRGGGGRRVALSRSILLDVLIERLHALALSHWRRETGKPPVPCALLALGGYGREELCPFSDIDIMFLYPSRGARGKDTAAFQRSVSDTILYMLWDLGLKVGHSTRTEHEAMDEAKADIQTKNALLESRRVCGDEGLAARFDRAYNRFIDRDNARAYIEERLKDQRIRRERFGNTIFLQEPDLKNGIGGLRDYQNILWMARLKLNTRDLSTLVKRGILSKNEQRALNEAHEFLLRARNELHVQSKRPTDLLNLEKQPRVAWGLGYRDRDIFRRVEIFMRDYYRHAHLVNRLSNYMEERLAFEANGRVTFRAVVESRRRPNEIDGFIIDRGQISFASERVFARDPMRLLRVFRHAQQFKVDIHFELIRLMERNLGLIDEAMVHSEEAARCFRSILQSRGEVYPALKQMNTTGVLSRIVPEWRDLHCLVQHEYYHRYTADEHTLETIRQLDDIFGGQEPLLTTKYREAIEETQLPALLYLVLLLHDIGKGRAIANHADSGAEIAEPILERLKLPMELRPRVTRLIRQHLEMARFWQHFDIDDPRTTSAFAEAVGDPENLRYLYVLTFCDARGTSAGLWNSYKDTLHTQLFAATRSHMGESPANMPRLEMTSKESILTQVPDLSKEEVEAHFNLLPERYFIHNNEEEIILHLRMVHDLLETIATAESLGSLSPVVEWRDDVNLGLSVVHVVTWDRAGLFYKLAGAFSVAGLSIVSSKALTRADHITIDTFYVSEPGGGVVREAKARELFRSHLEDALLHNHDLLPQIQEQAERHGKPKFLRKDEHLKANLESTVEVYHELSLRRTIIEIQATDGIGLLYKLARAIHDHGFDITFARISTEKDVAVDTFYIEPVDKNQSDANNLVALREALSGIVCETNGVEAAAG